MLVQSQKIYLTAVILVYLTTPLYYVITQECILFSLNLSPAYLSLLALFWLLWLGYTAATVLVSFSKLNYKPLVCSRRSEADVVKCHIWTELELNSSVDDALLGIINEILANHVLSWYSKISSDTEFTHEVRELLHYLSRAVILRLRSCDVTRLIKLKLIPCIIQHIHTYRLRANQDGDTQGLPKHPSIGHASRLPVYATHAVEILLRQVTPSQVSSSRLMTSLLSQAVGNTVISRGVRKVSNPLFLYRLFYQLLDPTANPITPQVPPSPSKPLLSLLLSPVSPLPCDLLDEELAIFIRYLKEIGELPVLQCLLDLSEVRELLDGPKVHKEAAVSKIRHTRETFFMSPGRHDLPLAMSSLDTLGGILDNTRDDAELITELQNSRIVHLLLGELIAARDRYLYPAFVRSSTFRSHTLAYKPNQGYSQVGKVSEDKKLGRNASFRVSKRESCAYKNSPLLTKKLIKSSTIDVPGNPESMEGRDIYRSRTISDTASHELALKERVTRSRSSGLENVCVSDEQLDFDLSKWDVSITEVTRIKTIKSFYQFVIHVSRRDVSPQIDWSIFRRYSEFEVLDSVLRKFFPAARLLSLPKKILFISGQELENRRQELELYLQALIKCTELQRSEVVCKFLCEFNDDKLFQGENFGDHAGRVLLALPKSILTDRYEFLNKPFEHFIESTIPPAYKHSADVIEKTHKSNKDWEHDSEIYEGVFQSNPAPDLPEGTAVPNLPKGTAVPKHRPHTLKCWLDILDFLFSSVLYVPYPLRMLVASLRTFLPFHTESLLERSVSDVITLLSNESYVTFAINKVRNVLYHSAHHILNRDLLKSELKIQKGLLRERMLTRTPSVVNNIIGKQLLLCNLELIMECLDYQVPNEQLIASLLDQIILELFPEIN